MRVALSSYGSNGKRWEEVLRFQVLDPSHPEYQERYFYASSYTIKVVRSSTGIAEKRFAIKTDLALFGKNYKVTFTLTNRKKMKYPVLIGRKFLTGRFLVDVALKNLSSILKSHQNENSGTFSQPKVVFDPKTSGSNRAERT